MLGTTPDYTSSKNISESEILQLEERLEISIPSSCEFCERVTFGDFDPTFVYIYELNIPNEVDNESVDEYIREQLRIDTDVYYNTDSASKGTYASKLSDVGYEFTHKITYKADGFYELYYVLQDDTILIALCYSIV